MTIRNELAWLILKLSTYRQKPVKLAQPLSASPINRGSPYFTGLLTRFVKPFTCSVFRDTPFLPFNHLGYLLTLGLILRKSIITDIENRH